MNRSEFLSAAIGQPWLWQGGNCWDFAVRVQSELFGRDLPSIAVPREMTKRWVLQEFDNNPERAEWQEVQSGPSGLITASDGALVLMAHLRMPAHVGVWLRPEQHIIHCDEIRGVCFETPLALKQTGWKSLRYFEPMEN